MGVGGHLFAIACKESWDVGNEGYVAFDAKTNLVNHYKDTLKAFVAVDTIPPRMVLDTKAALYLIKKYILDER